MKPTTRVAAVRQLPSNALVAKHVRSYCDWQLKPARGPIRMISDARPGITGLCSLRLHGRGEIILELRSDLRVSNPRIRGYCGRHAFGRDCVGSVAAIKSIKRISVPRGREKHRQKYHGGRS